MFTWLWLILGAADDAEDWTNNYPMTPKYLNSFHDLRYKWRVNPLSAFTLKGNLIKPRDLEITLQGSLVLVYFQLKHFSIKEGTDKVKGNTFSALATQVIILETPKKLNPTPYKSRMLRGPTLLP
jgi:hypothetical protein